MTTSAEKIRAWKGPAILSFGFRPFFLLAGIWAALAMALWVLMLTGRDVLPTAFDPVSWHAHEFLFGYLGAVLAGFLLTAVPNWTGRLPIVGWPLAALVAVIAPDIFMTQGQLITTWKDARLFAAAAGVAYFFWRRGILGTIATGMVVLLALRFVLGW